MGGHPETYGSDAQQWSDEVRQKVEQQFVAKTEGGIGAGYGQLSKKSPKKDTNGEVIDDLKN